MFSAQTKFQKHKQDSLAVVEGRPTHRRESHRPVLTSIKLFAIRLVRVIDANTYFLKLLALKPVNNSQPE